MKITTKENSFAILSQNFGPDDCDVEIGRDDDEIVKGSGQLSVLLEKDLNGKNGFLYFSC